MSRFSFLRRWPFVGLALAVLIAPVRLGGHDSGVVAPSGELRVSATLLPLNRNDPGADRIGPLVFKGALHIRAADADFGGISGLRAGLNGQFLAITDTGKWLSFRTFEKQGRLVGIVEVRMRPMMMDDGRPAANKEAGDAESLEWNPKTGEASVVFEQVHRILHWVGLDPRQPETLNIPAVRTERLAEMADWPANGGGEAMVRWRAPDGLEARLIVSEDVVLDGGYRLALLTHAGRTRTIGLEGVDEHRPTDAVMIDDHRMMLLHRRFNLKGAGAAISVVDLTPLFGNVPADRLKAEVLARWEAPFLLDNMEGLAVVHEGKRLSLYIVSDNNLSRLQKTLLMKFSLDLP